ncbi:MAG: response regulator transcription factor [Saprospiraceae bacterium]|nr:response regulator transcription factor [Saprospiraceae bacterium]
MNILIIEDEQPACKRLLRFIEDFNPTYRIAACLDSVQDSLLWLEEHNHPDLIFLDVHLSDGNSFEILRNAGMSCPVIFTTAHSEYLTNAFEVFTIDYLFKPIKRQAFRNAMYRFLERRPTFPPQDHLLESTTDRATPGSTTKILVKLGKHLKLLELNNAIYYIHMDRMTILCATDDKRYPLDQSLDQIEKMLGDAAFFRINRQTLINYNNIADIITRPKSRLEVKMDDKKRSTFVVSVERTVAFKEWLINARVT